MKKKFGFILFAFALFLCIVLMAITNLPKQNVVEDQSQEENANLKFLYFGKDTYESSIQAKSTKIDWETYDSAPLSTSLTKTLFNDEPYFTISAPDWQESLYETTIVVHEAPVYIAFTIKESRSDLFNETVKNLKQIEELKRFHEDQIETVRIGNFEIQKRVGSCTAETTIVELRQYVSYTFTDGILQYYFIGVTTRGSDTTVTLLAEAIEGMIESISFEGME